MTDQDQILIQTTSTHRERLTAALVHGDMSSRRKVRSNIGRMLGSIIIAAVLGIGCVGTSFVVGLLAQQKEDQAIADFRSAAESNPIQPGDGFVEDNDTGLLRNEQTGEYIDPRTGFTVDPETMLATDPSGRLIDVRLGWYYDPETGYYTDPSSGITIDPTTLQVVEEPSS